MPVARERTQKRDGRILSFPDFTWIDVWINSGFGKSFSKTQALRARRRSLDHELNVARASRLISSAEPTAWGLIVLDSSRKR